MSDFVEIPDADLVHVKKLQDQLLQARVQHSTVVEENVRRAKDALRNVAQTELALHKLIERISSELLDKDALEKFDWHVSVETGKILKLGPTSK